MKTLIPLFFVASAVAQETGKTATKVWFAAPAKSFHESCVVGNGRLGAMDFGGMANNRIVLNESSMWSGGSYDANKYDAFQCLPEVRAKLFAKDLAGAGGVLGNGFRYPNGVKGWADSNQFGCYQVLEDLTLTAGTALNKVSSPSGHEDGDGKMIDGSVSKKSQDVKVRVNREINPGWPGCDAIFHARSKDLTTWEVYSENQTGRIPASAYLTFIR